MPDDHAQELWYQALKDIQYQTMYLAIMKWKDVEPWSPTIADLRKMCCEIKNGEIKSWDEAWENVLQAVRYFGYNRRIEAMDSLDDITRKTVGRVGWMQICTSEEIAVERANFRTIYNGIAEKQRKSDQIAPAVLKAINLSMDSQKAFLEEKTIAGNCVEEKQNGNGDVPDSIQSKIDALKEKLKS